MDSIHGPGGTGPIEPNKPIEGKKGFKSSDLPKGTDKKPGLKSGKIIKGVRKGEAKAGGHSAITELKKLLGTEDLKEIKEALATMVGKMDSAELAENVGGLAKAVALSSKELGQEYHKKMLDDLLKTENEALLEGLINGVVEESPEEYLSQIRTIAPEA